MNNGASLNSTTINGWRGDVTVRIQVISFAMATGGLVARAWRRSTVEAEASVSPAEGRVWRRSPQSAQATAEATIVYRFFRWIHLSALADAYATAVITAISKPPTPVRQAVSAIASSSASLTAGAWFRGVLAATASATSVVKPRAFVKLKVSGEAIATGGIDTSVYRQLPWDEYALPEYTFTVANEPNIFYVVS